MRQEKTNTIKYILYARKSSESEDRQMASIDSQIVELEKLARDDNLQVTEVMQESKSAKEPGRKVFNAMVQKIRNGEADGILCWKLNRLARNPIDGGIISWLLQTGTIKHIFTCGRNYYPNDNVLMMTVELGMANQFVRDLSSDTKRGLKNKAERGWYPCHAVLGYLHNPLKLKGDKEILKDPEKFDRVRKMLKMVASKKYTPVEVYKKAVWEWKLTNKHSRRFAISTWYAMLKNPFYYGWYEYPAKSSQWYKGKHAPMITRVEFERIQMLLGRKGITRPQKHNFKYTGAICCGICGAAVTAEYKTKKCKNGNTHFYTYYHCTGRKDPYCKQKVIEEKELENQIMQILSKIKIPPTFLDWAIKKLKEENKQETEEKKQILETSKKEYVMCEERLDKLMDMRINGELSENEFVAKKEKLLQEKARLGANLDKHEGNSTDWVDQLEKTKEILNFAQDALDQFKSGDHEKKKEIFRALGSNLSLKDKKINIEANNKIVGLQSISYEIKMIHKRFEPLKMQTNKEKLEFVYSSSPVLLREQDSNL